MLSVRPLISDTDMQHCPNCGGELKIISAMLERPVIEQILSHLGLDAQLNHTGFRGGP